MIGAFDVIGPRMVGPSSSHTAGAVRLGLALRDLAGGCLETVAVGLHGSFAATGKGHATDRALVAGMLGFLPDDERLRDAPSIAAELGVHVTFEEIDLGPEAHPNSVRMQSSGNSNHCLVGSSIGGGQIRVVEIDSFANGWDGSLDALVLWHRDTPGFLARVTSLLACVEANIATIKTTRRQRAASALTVVEIDGEILAECVAVLERMPAISEVRILRAV